jgi:hypothetical protein
MFARILLAAGLIAQMALVLEAQQPGPGQLTPAQQQRLMRELQKQGINPQGQPMQGFGIQNRGVQGVPFKESGTLDAIGQGQIKIIDSKGTERIITLNQQTLIKTTGEATVEYLKNGIAVEFTAEVDAKGNTTGKIEELKVVNVTKDYPAGVTSENGEPPVKPAKGKKEKGKEKDKTDTVAKGVSSKVVGIITSLKAGKGTVKAGKRVVQFELGEKPKITIELEDGSLASKGDKVEIDGFEMPNMPNQPAVASSVTITLSEPVGESKKKGESGKSETKPVPKALKPKKSDKGKADESDKK